MSLASCLLLVSAAIAPMETLTLPQAKRPAWLQDGIVMAGSWEALPFRAQRDCGPAETPSAEQREGYARELSPRTIGRLKDLGVNFVMMHAYKGLGLVTEQQSMLDAVRFSAMCHEAGLRVGVYCNSGTFSWELMFRERPDAAGWLTLNHLRLPIMYGYAPYRFRWDRNHPDAAAFHREIVRFSVRDIRADLLHFDNYNVGPGSELNAQRRFRTYLNRRFSADELTQMKAAGSEPVLLPLTKDADPMLHRAFALFASESLADSYYALTRDARRLRPDVLLELNPGGPGEQIRWPVDHGRMLGGGEAFWDEGEHPGLHEGRLRTRIRTYKVGRAMDNIAFAYTLTPLEAAESMAFNLDCFGCICWFEYGDIVDMPGSTKPVSPSLDPYIRFYLQRRDLFRDGTVVADVAVLRSFASQVFAEPQHAKLTGSIEQELIERRVPFQILYEQQLDRLSQYNVLVLAGCVALSDAQIETIERYVAGGGRLVLVGPAGTHDEWMRPRGQPAFTTLDERRVTRITADDGIDSALQEKLPGALSLRIGAPRGVCAEQIRQTDRLLVHLVNYADEAAQNVRVRLRVPAGRRVDGVTLVSPEHTNDITVPVEKFRDDIRFAVPQLGVYEIAVVDLK